MELIIYNIKMYKKKPKYINDYNISLYYSVCASRNTSEIE